MEKSIRRQQLVIAIQEYATQEGMGAADVLRRLSDRHCDVSETTIRRILKATPSQEHFSFDVLQRVSNALFDLEAAPVPAAEINTAEEAEREALRAVSALTEAALKDATDKIANLEQALEAAQLKISKLSALADFFAKQNVEKDAQINKLLELLSRR